ncbi:MAG: aspartate carbamoyltransferase [Alphaproteobacteria bacterium]|nr:aspartate carbamoyltransferase [Alphaproteobacteria bacterium]
MSSSDGGTGRTAGTPDPDPAAPRFGAHAQAPFQGHHILSVKQFDRADLDYVFRVAHDMRTMVDLVGSIDLLHGKVLANLFYEPSTRTSSSFQAAMVRLGGSVVAISEVRYSSVAKGETLEDTVRTLEAYTDVLVLRHHEVGAAARAAVVARKPVINAGDGAGEHPTQALLDLFTIREELGRLDGVTVALVGDLKHGRTVHSLARLARHFGITLRLVSPVDLRMPDDVLADLVEAGVEHSEHRDLAEVIGGVDVLYMTRVQKERFADPAAYEAVKGSYVITPDTMRHLPARAVLMHPFPRVDEIHTACDADPRSAYFRQIAFGMYVRMALLAMVLGRA